MATTRGKRLEVCLEIMNRRAEESDYGRNKEVNYSIANEIMVAVNDLLALWGKAERWTVAQARAQMKRYIIDKDYHGTKWYRDRLINSERWVTTKDKMKFDRPASEPRPAIGITMPRPKVAAAPAPTVAERETPKVSEEALAKRRTLIEAAANKARSKKIDGVVVTATKRKSETHVS